MVLRSSPDDHKTQKGTDIELLHHCQTTYKLVLERQLRSFTLLESIRRPSILLSEPQSRSEILSERHRNVR